jgi:dihydroneopterin aldolase
VAKAAMEVCGSRDFHLIETVAERIATRILADFPTDQVRVVVRKHSPVLEPRVNYVSIEIVRQH